MPMTTRQKMAAARVGQLPLLAVRRLLGRGSEAIATRNGVTWRLDLREGIDFAIWARGTFEPSTVAAYRRLLRPGMTVIDIGANVGAHTLRFAQAVGVSGHVFAYEPTGDAFARLTATIGTNPELAARIDARQVMLLASDDGELPTSVIASWPLKATPDLHPTIRGRALSTIGASVSTLDALMERAAPARVDLIKLDVDGYECDVIDGGRRTIAKHRPLILIEIAAHALRAANRTSDELMTRLHDAGYHLSTLRGKPLRSADLERLSRHRVSMNVIGRFVDSGGPEAATRSSEDRAGQNV
jgi:FkbM family methyltransferase